MTEPLLTETYSSLSPLRMTLRGLFLLGALALLVFLMQSRQRISGSGREFTPPPQAERLPIISLIQQEKDEVAQQAREEKLGRLRSEVLTLIDNNPPPAPYPDAGIQVLLEGLSETDKAPILTAAQSARATLEKNYAQVVEQQKREKELAERRAREEARRQAARAAATPATVGTPDYANEEITGPVPGCYVTVYLSRRFMGLTVGQRYIRQYRNIAVPAETGAKQSGNDARAPVGRYYVCAREVLANGRTLTLSYPNTEDARAALERGAIDETTFRAIESACKAHKTPPQDTPLGGGIRITGNRDTIDQTDGGIAIEPAQMDELWTATRIGTWVIIQP